MEDNFKYEGCNTNTLLVVEKQGSIVELKCPILVFCSKPLGDLEVNRTLAVTEVKTTIDDRLVYIIRGKPYYHSHFHFIYNIFRNP